MAAQEDYIPDSDDEIVPDDMEGVEEAEEVTEVPLTPEEWKAKAGDLYKVWAECNHQVGGVVGELPRQEGSECSLVRNYSVNERTALSLPRGHQCAVDRSSLLSLSATSIDESYE